MYYFDHAASTKLYPEVVEILSHSFALDYPNPAAKHRAGKECAKKIEQARTTILRGLGLAGEGEYEIIFTSSATEANNQIIRSVEKGIIYISGDHPSVTKVIDAGAGFKRVEDAIEAIDDNSKLLCLSLVNSQSGQILDVEYFANEAKKRNPNILVHVDATQGLGKVPLSLVKSAVDFVSFGAHKMGGPRGIGGLIFRSKLADSLKRYLRGGGHEKGLRASTPATSLILAMAKACEIAFDDLEEKLQETAQLKEMIKDSLAQLHKNISYPFEELNTSAYILCVLFEGIASDVLMRHLEAKDIMISSSTACSAKIKGKNPLFEGLGIDEKFHKNILRISLGKSTAEAEVKALISGFKEVIDEVGFLIK